MSKELRYYQKDAIEAVFSALKRGRKKQMIVLPGGTGKTVICVNVMHKFNGRKLWITHEEELGDQSCIEVLAEAGILPYEEILATVNHYGGIKNILQSHFDVFPPKYDQNRLIIARNIGMIKADVFDIDKPIVVASAQTLWKRLDKIPEDWFSCIIVDEGDLFGSKTFQAPLTYFKPQLLLSATATPFRSDGMLMEDIFEEIVYEYTLQQAIADGYLTELNAIVIKTNTNLDDVHTSMGDFNQKELTVKVNTLERNALIVNKYIEYCNGQQFICFGADVQHVIDLHEAFKERGINTAYVVSDKDRMVPGTNRKDITRAFKSGELIGLINFNIYTAGFDHRDCGAVILGCPTKSKRKFLQQLFRVTRLKTDSFVRKFGQIGTILDVVDGTSKHNVINTRELDKGLPIEERVFISKKNKELLLEARREREMTVALLNEDKKVQLIPLPTVKLYKTLRTSEPATQPQLDVIKRWGYDVEKTTYTKHMISKIFGDQQANDKSIEKIKKAGYDVDGKFVSVSQVQMAEKEIATRKYKRNIIKK